MKKIIDMKKLKQLDEKWANNIDGASKSIIETMQDIGSQINESLVEINLKAERTLPIKAKISKLSSIIKIAGAKMAGANCSQEDKSVYERVVKDINNEIEGLENMIEEVKRNCEFEINDLKQGSQDKS